MQMNKADGGSAGFASEAHEDELHREEGAQAQAVAARRRQILEAAVSVFVEKGFARATIRDIARAAGVADGTIYNYFENKEALLFGLLHMVNESEAREEHFGTLEAEKWTDFLRSYLRHRMQIVGDRHADLLQVLLAETLVNSELRRQYYSQVLEPTVQIARSALGQMGTLAERDVEFLVHVLPATVLGLHVMQMLGDDYMAREARTLPDALADLFVNYFESKKD